MFNFYCICVESWCENYFGIFYLFVVYVRFFVFLLFLVFVDKVLIVSKELLYVVDVKELKKSKKKVKMKFWLKLYWF